MRRLLASVLALSLAVAVSPARAAASCYTGKVPLPSSAAERATTPCCCGGDWSCCLAQQDGKRGPQRRDQEPAPRSDEQGRATIFTFTGFATPDAAFVRAGVSRPDFQPFVASGFVASKPSVRRHLQLSILTN